jgi:transcriptional regulator with XRE-family HTH domain
VTKRRGEDREVLREFGASVREWRLARGLSQEDLALKSGLDRTYVGGVERGERNLGLLNIHRLARSLGVKPRDLLR